MLAIRYGGLKARAWDETFPAAFGQTGDEGLGLGGLSNLWRSAPEIAQLAQTLAAEAPSARVLNLMAPLGMSTRLLLQEDLDVVGLCELPVTTRLGLLESFRRSDSEGLRYGGLNHLGWFWHDAEWNHPLFEAAIENGVLDRETFECFRAAPLFYYYRVFQPEAARRLGTAAAPGRATSLEELADALVTHFEKDAAGVSHLERQRSTPWFEHSVVPAVAALLGGEPYEGFVNVPNRDLIPELPPECIVEVPGTIATQGWSSRSPGPLPPEVAAFLRRLSGAEEVAFIAARERDSALMRRAVACYPLSLRSSDHDQIAQMICQGPNEVATPVVSRVVNED